MLKLQHLTKQFGAAPLFTDLCMEVDAPVVLWAPSGWGKTTLLRILMGLERPTTGSVEGVGRVAAVFQEDRLCPQLNAVQNVTLVLPGAENQYKEQIINEFQQLGMDTAALQLPARRLSGGQKRRVALLRALYLPGGVGTAPALSRCGLLAFFFCTCLALPQAVWQGMNGVDTPGSFPLAITLGCTGLLGAACARNIARRG